MSRFSFQIRAVAGRARCAVLHTPHGEIQTPAFMPVGTKASVKGVTPDQLVAAGASIILANTYHLALRPGADIVAEMGGLHRFMSWDRPILTDSGGFQVFSLATLNSIDDDGVTFKSHIDGAVLRLSPSEAVEIQEKLGADIIMAFDQCPPLPASPDLLRQAVDRTIRWARDCRDAKRRDDQALFGIVQGGLDLDLRCRCLDEIVKLDFPGYAIGGLSVGEAPEEMAAFLNEFTHRMPDDRPRYLMGVGRPIDILRAVNTGVDMFDCVLPTRNGRNAFAFCDAGFVRIRNSRYKTDPRPLVENCDCYACSHFSRAYLRHLFLAGEMLGPMLVSLHNIAYYQRLMRRIRETIAAGTFHELLAAFAAFEAGLTTTVDNEDAE
ncbi:MAG: tRNA guanosine(34) transglycosylase Tgt [Planctomycetia bacterium]|nr:tRNA guanosine(34) transglycosylase Tgt [Planctomycetia bacterium]MCC7315568.1 tRNA guanosine(34) transglycosylase Tgt [Planctomycetota bacterium]OQZ07082.1 MAG: tRNA guanosine(34) transglycosylase Tgt [Planctomycetes bacterium UTPLA1]